MRLTDRFHQALSYASQLHKEQTRKGTEVPYISHLMAVAGLVLEHGADEDVAIAALLHDALEDQGGGDTRTDIRQRFGERVLSIVEGCTEKQADPKPPWRDRKENYIAHLSAADHGVVLVSLADKLHNARAIWTDYKLVGESIWDRFNGGREGSLWYYRALADGFARMNSAPKALVDELDRVVALIEHKAGEGSSQ